MEANTPDRKLLSKLRNLGIKLRVVNGELRYEAPAGSMTRELLAEISQKKTELIAFLSQVALETKQAQDPIIRVAREGEEGRVCLPVSFSQQSLWFYDQLMGGNPVYNIPNAIRIEGELDLAALEASLTEIAARHESLRTIFKSKNGAPVQEILPPGRLSLPVTEITALPVAEREKELQRLLSAESWKPFDLEKGPLWRAILFKLAEKEYLLSFTIHHIISDAWSNSIFVREFLGFYEAFSCNKALALPPLSIQFADYAYWQRQQLGRPEIAGPMLAYWRKQLAEPTILELPADHTRPPAQSFTGKTQKFLLSPELSLKLKTFCQNEDVTIFMLLTAAFKTLLYRYTGQEDIIVGTVVANRNQRACASELSGLIGFIMNTLALRTDFSGNPHFVEILSRVKQTTLDAYKHQDLPFDMLLEELKPERDPSRTPLFQVMYIHQNLEAVPMQAPGLKITPVEVENRAAPFDLRLITEETALGINCRLDYCAALYEDDTALRILEHYGHLLESIIAGPKRKVNALSFLSAPEQRRILTDFNDTAVSYPTDRLIHERFEEQARKTPETVAVVFEGHPLTYRELNCQANQLARFLKELGVGPDFTVGVCLERSLEMVVSLLGILKAGGAYVPFDLGYPRDRIAYMIEEARVGVLITRTQCLGQIPEVGARQHTQLVCLDREWENIYGKDPANLSSDVGAATKGNHLAYIIFTSGSTGAPKGAMNTHLGMLNHKLWMQDVYKLAPEDRVLQKTPFSFDVSVWEFFWPLITGARLVVAKPEGHKDPEYLVRTIIAEGITVIHFVPSMLGAFLEHPDIGRCASLRQVFCSGEALSIDLQNRFFNTFKIPLRNVYGPAECSDVATAWTCDENDNSRAVPIGRPISNARVYILDPYLNPAPVGVLGELYVGGIGVGRGYINNPAMTAERFIPDPFYSGNNDNSRLVTRNSKLMYRTGDLARHRRDGNIEYCGRADFQVKIRGLRIELGEVEKSLAGHPRVKENAVVLWEKDQTHKYLAAYIAPQSGQTPGADELRDFLGKKLPQYMIPDLFIFLDSLPLNPNGKLDRKALPVPDISQINKSSQYLPARNGVERILTDIWQEAIGTEQIGINDDFFEIGGHSLLATVVLSRARQVFHVDISLQTFLENATISALAKLCSGKDEDNKRIDGTQTPYGNEWRDLNTGVIFENSIPKVAAQEYYPLSSAQRRMFLLNQMDRESLAYNLVQVFRIDGAFDPDRLSAIMEHLIERHESLRASFEMIEGRPVRRIHPKVAFKIEYQEIKDDKDGIDRAIGEFIKPYNLAAPPLFRFKLLKVNSSFQTPYFLLLQDMHHIIADGVSVAIMVQEVNALYANKNLPELKTQYKDYVAWHEQLLLSEAVQSQKRFWLEELGGELPMLNLPFDFARPPVFSFRGDSVYLRINRELKDNLYQLAKSIRVTLFTVLLAAYNTLLFKYTGQNDIIVGSPVAGRRHADLARTLGVFINSLVFRCFPEAERSFIAFLREVGQKAAKIFDNQDYPFEQMVEDLKIQRDLSRNPVFDTIFNLWNMDIGAIKAEGLDISKYEFKRGMAQLDITVIAEEDEDGINVEINFCADLFRRSSMERFGGHFIRILAEVAMRPETTLGEVDMLSEEERRQILFELNATWAEYPREKTIHRLFEEQVERTPDNIAVIYGDASARSRLTYRELNTKANRLARTLRDKGVGHDSIVGIMVERSPEMIIGIMGILKAGGAYLPVSPDYPGERIRYMLENSGARLLLIQRKFMAAAAIADIETIDLEDTVSYAADSVNVKHIDSVNIKYIDDINLESVNSATDLAYVIYTSGSTGRPKGAMIEHHSVINRLGWMQKKYPIGEDDVIMQKTPFTFDVSVWELFWWSFAGAKVYFLEPGGEKDPASIVAAIQKNSITTIHFVPSMLSVFVAYVESALGMARLKSLRRVFASGEALSLQLAQQFNELLYKQNGTELHNLYGPTEATVDVSYFDCARIDATDVIPIGKPIDNIGLYILNNENQLQPVGVPGELFITGVGLARGYLNNPGLTAEKFVPNPFGDVDASHGTRLQRIYKTGDLARWMPDGNIEFLGRIDNQVKIRGNRIELGEIESALLKHETVKEAVVIDKKDKDGVTGIAGAKYLCAYIVGSTHACSLPDIRAHLAKELPDYMIPSYFVPLSGLPLTPNGKIDRRALLKMEEGINSLHAGVEYVAPKNSMEKVIAAVWKEVLQPEQRFGVNDNFFEIGGNSLAIIRVNNLLNQRLKPELTREISVTAMFQHPTIHALAQYLQQESKGADGGAYDEAGQSELEIALTKDKMGLNQMLNLFKAGDIE